MEEAGRSGAAHICLAWPSRCWIETILLLFQFLATNGMARRAEARLSTRLCSLTFRGYFCSSFTRRFCSGSHVPPFFFFDFDSFLLRLLSPFPSPTRRYYPLFFSNTSILPMHGRCSSRRHYFLSGPYFVQARSCGVSAESSKP